MRRLVAGTLSLTAAAFLALISLGPSSPFGDAWGGVHSINASSGVVGPFETLTSLGPSSPFGGTWGGVHSINVSSDVAGPVETLTSCDAGSFNGAIAQLFRSPATGGTIDFACNGLILITATITIPSGDSLALDATGYHVMLAELRTSAAAPVQILSVQGGTLALTNLTMMGGAVLGAPGLDGASGSAGEDMSQPADTVQGGALYLAKSSTVTLTDCTFQSNLALGSDGGSGGDGAKGGKGGTGEGGAIYNAGTLTVIDSTFSNNIAQGGGGGLGGVGANGGAAASGGAGGKGKGGAIYNSGTLTIDGGTFSNDTARGGYDGGGGDGEGGSTSGSGGVNGGNGATSGNGGDAFGGAIYDTGTLTINRTTFLDNSALGGSGTTVCSGCGGAGGPGGFHWNEGAGGNGGNGGDGGTSGSAEGGAIFVGGPQTGLSIPPGPTIINQTTYTGNVATAGLAIGGGLGGIPGYNIRTGQAAHHGQPGTAGDAGISAGDNLYDLLPLVTNVQVSTTAPLPYAVVGVAYSFNLAAIGGTAPYSWKLTANSSPLPSWLTLSPGGTLSGTPTAVGSVVFTVQVTDSSQPPETATAQLDFATGPAQTLQITTSSLPLGQVKQPYSVTLVATGGTNPYAWSLASGSSLPAGLSLSPSGKISGTPTAAASHSTVVVDVIDTSNPVQTSHQELILWVMAAGIIPPLVVTTVNLPSGSVGAAYSQTLAAIGGTPPYAWSVINGKVPAGLNLNPATGVISGSPTTTSSSSQPGFTVRVTDSSSPPAAASESEETIVVAAGTAPTVGADSAVSTSPTGSASAGGGNSAASDTAATASGGSGTVYVATYGQNPGGPSPFLAGAGFFDVSLSAGASFTSVAITECGVATGAVMQWFNSTANSPQGAWQPVSPPATYSNGCLSFTASSSATAPTSPTVAQLTATVMGAGARRSGGRGGSPLTQPLGLWHTLLFRLLLLLVGAGVLATGYLIISRKLRPN